MANLGYTLVKQKKEKHLVKLTQTSPIIPSAETPDVPSADSCRGSGSPSARRSQRRQGGTSMASLDLDLKIFENIWTLWSECFLEFLGLCWLLFPYRGSSFILDQKGNKVCEIDTVSKILWFWIFGSQMLSLLYRPAPLLQTSPRFPAHAVKGFAKYPTSGRFGKARPQFWGTASSAMDSRIAVLLTHGIAQKCRLGAKEQIRTCQASTSKAKENSKIIFKTTLWFEDFNHKLINDKIQFKKDWPNPQGSYNGLQFADHDGLQHARIAHLWR